MAPKSTHTPNRKTDQGTDFQAPNTCSAPSPPPARPPPREGPCRARPSHAGPATGSCTPRVLREHLSICLHLFFFFLTTSMWEESWEGYEQSRPPNPDLREARHSFGSHGPRSMTVVIVCTRSVVCPLERTRRLKTPALGDTGSRCTHKANPENACEFLAGASVTWGVVLQPPPARTCCHQPPPSVRLPCARRAPRACSSQTGQHAFSFKDLLKRPRVPPNLP